MLETVEYIFVYTVKGKCMQCYSQLHLNVLHIVSYV